MSNEPAVGRDCDRTPKAAYARAYRMILVALDRDADTPGSFATFNAVVDEFDDCPHCRWLVMMQLATFGAGAITHSRTPERRELWERRLLDRIAGLLDDAAAAS
jgi:hypothetical protein